MAQLCQRVVPFFLLWGKVQRDCIVRDRMRAVQYRIKKVLALIFFLLCQGCRRCLLAQRLHTARADCGKLGFQLGDAGVLAA